MASPAGPASSPLILASASPRRHWLLGALRVPFRVMPVDIDERPHPDEHPATFVRRMAREKAEAAHARDPAWVLAADTIVELDGRVFGKPHDGNDAAAMLAQLSGRIHAVRTAVTLLQPSGASAGDMLVSTDVVFRVLDAATIRAYVDSGEPLGKAGAYAIQGEGAHLVDRVMGSYTNVIGLPVPEVAEWLDRWHLR
jgi:septum formation protein